MRSVACGRAGFSQRGTHRPLDRLWRLATRRLALTPAQGARPILFAATSPGVRSGDYIGPGGRSGSGYGALPSWSGLVTTATTRSWRATSGRYRKK
jgi:hypothetical protein